MSASGSTIMWFFAPPSAWQRLPVCGRRLVDVLRDRRRADERDRGDVRVLEQRVDGDLVAVDDVEDAVRDAGLLAAARPTKIDADGSFSDGLSTNVFPQAIAGAHIHIGHHRREVERRDPGDDAERLADRVDVDPGRGLLGEVALEQRRDPAAVLDHLEPARDLALRVGEDLAVLGGEDAARCRPVRRRSSSRMRKRSSGGFEARSPATRGTPAFAACTARVDLLDASRSRRRRTARRSPGCTPGRCGRTRPRRRGRRSSGGSA